ncbi:unnamed protein product [Prorocentrum cordatum]|uniref:Carbohydrate kinase PfkB domain-containing protein n=1 Tax=Prorocentrum cordatum TaxID=2364126 RepID=A0ABN9PJA8_9DINO|nr:unnamed protein product [Polarella glacialis]
MPGPDACKSEADAKVEHDMLERPKDRILFYGNLCLDNVLEVAAYPKEDTGSRALASRKVLGGNGANSTRVLKQLRGGRCTVSWIGPVPRRGDPDTAFALGVLEADGVDTSLLEEVGGEGLPTSFIVTSRESGSRTIVSTRNGVRELGEAHLEAAVRRMLQEEARLGRPCWCHLECRQAPEVTARMAEAWRSVTGDRALPLSVEVEKPGMDVSGVVALLGTCTHAFFSSEWIKAHEDELLADGSVTEPAEKRQRTEEQRQQLAPRCLSALRGRAPGAAGLWVCAWGDLGAFALDAATGTSYFQPAVKQARVVDSVGAGDTFNAATSTPSRRGLGPSWRWSAAAPSRAARWPRSASARCGTRCRQAFHGGSLPS